VVNPRNKVAISSEHFILFEEATDQLSFRIYTMQEQYRIFSFFQTTVQPK